jgi:hypothetical protein
MLAVLIASASAQEITLEEVRVEAEFLNPLELPFSKALDQLTDRLRLRDENTRALDLQQANKSSVTRILDLTRYSPIPLGASDPRVDTFLQENYMRADLNPPKTRSIFE